MSLTSKCSCGMGTQTPEHILQTCTSVDDQRRVTWPKVVELWGPTDLLKMTAVFTAASGLTV